MPVSGISKVVSFFAQGLGMAVGGFPISGAELLIGFGLSFIKKEDVLGEKQLLELKKINQNLNGIIKDLLMLGSDLEQIEQTLEKILGQEKLSNWLAKQNTIVAASAHIETDFQTYQGYMAPQSSGQLPHVSPSDLESLATRAYLFAGLTDEEAVIKIQEAVVGSGAGDGLLDLYVILLEDFMHQKNPSTITSEDLDFLASGLISYFSRLLAHQVNGIAVVIECKCMNNVDPSIMQKDWKDFLASVDDQSDIFLNAMWSLISLWRNMIQASEHTLNGIWYSLHWLFSIEGLKLFSDNDLLAFLPGAVGDDIYFKEVNQWYHQHYSSTLVSSEQDYLIAAENLVAAINLQDPQARRVVIHVLLYTGVVKGETDVQEAFKQPIELSNSNVISTVDLHKFSMKSYTEFFVYWVRHVFDLNTDGAFKMKNVRDSFPKWSGYEAANRQYVFQSDADLELEAKVSADTPVGVIRFVPYVQSV